MNAKQNETVAWLFFNVMTFVVIMVILILGR